MTTPPTSSTSRTAPGRSRRVLLFFAFAFAVMADPVSSTAYAIEAALRALDGNIEYLLPTMFVVIGVVGLVTVNYWYLVGRFAKGGGDAEAAGRAFGTKWAFPVIGALIVDFVLTIAISIAAASSAVIAYLPELESWRIPIAIGLSILVAGVSWFGHGGRMIFAIFTVLFLVASALVLIVGAFSPVVEEVAVARTTGEVGNPWIAIFFAFPVAMALATGIEAPLTSVAQLGELDDNGKRRFGRGTLVLTVVIVGLLTLSLTLLAVARNVGLPDESSTMIADIARTATGDGALFTLFQGASAILLLAAASSSFQAGPGLLKALARPDVEHGESYGLGILPKSLGRVNRHHTPFNAVLVYLLVSIAVVVAARAEEQELVLFYAVAVFASFLMGLLAMLKFNRSEGRTALVVFNILATLAVGFTLAINLGRGYPLVSLVATVLIGYWLYRKWVKAGRPEGVESIEQHIDEDVA
jgi:amino acid transporter